MYGGRAPKAKLYNEVCIFCWPADGLPVHAHCPRVLLGSDSFSAFCLLFKLTETSNRRECFTSIVPGLPIKTEILLAQYKGTNLRVLVVLR